MKTDKKTEIIRLVIYYVIALLPLCIMTAVLNSTVDDGYIYNHIEDKPVPIYVLGALGMLCPSVAVIFTRLITKEGFGNNYLAINFKGNGKYYAASVLVMLAINIITALIALVCFSDAPPREMFSSEDIAAKIWLLLLNIEASVIMFFSAFGEEWGWRGYMMPKLIKLMGKPWAVIVGGILWGLWHAPLTMSGHNFGTDYKFFPWLGILLMCVFCTAFNAFLTLLSEKTKSVYPCTFAHAINNNISAVMLIGIFCNEGIMETFEQMTFLQGVLLSFGLRFVLGIVCMVIIIAQKEKKTENLPASACR
ncbi:MAG: CPBP family intramembrane glutamic endopeptidase [Huintestinicola sp.]